MDDDQEPDIVKPDEKQPDNPDTSSAKQPPPIATVAPVVVTGSDDPSGRRLLHVVFSVFLAMAAIAYIWVFILVVGLIITAYSGHNDPTSVNGLAFPFAVAIYIIVGLPVLGVTYLIWLGYNKTKAKN